MKSMGWETGHRVQGKVNRPDLASKPSIFPYAIPLSDLTNRTVALYAFSQAVSFGPAMRCVRRSINPAQRDPAHMV